MKIFVIAALSFYVAASVLSFTASTSRLEDALNKRLEAIDGAA